MNTIIKTLPQQNYHAIITGKKKCIICNYDELDFGPKGKANIGDIITLYTVDHENKATIPIKHIHVKITWIDDYFFPSHEWNFVKALSEISKYFIVSFDVISDKQYDDIERSKMLSDIEKVSNDIKYNTDYKSVLKRK